IAALTGTAKTQYEELNKILFGVGEEVKTNVSDLAKHVVEVADQLGLTGIFINFKGGSGGGSSGRMQYKAEGGTIDGYSPHDKADNIVIKATAGEYMQPVKAVQHYGVDVMEAIRNREIPKEALQGFADGGLVGGSTKEASLINFGRWLQGQGYHVGEHPSFGGVMAGAHLSTARGGLHYVGKAIDVNYDGLGQQRENSALDAIIKAAERLGLGYIWRSANHYDHAHFDVSARRRLNGQTISVAEGLSDIITDDQGNTYDQAFFNLLKEKKSFRKFERSMDRWKILRDNYEDDTLAKAVSMKVAESIGASQDIEDYESGRMSNGVERWRPMVLQALDRMNQPANLADVTLRRMMQESSGNPRASNLWDSNGKAGTPSKGLM